MKTYAKIITNYKFNTERTIKQNYNLNCYTFKKVIKNIKKDFSEVFKNV